MYGEDDDVYLNDYCNDVNDFIANKSLIWVRFVLFNKYD
jgi:hypothetical protein